MTIRRLFLWMFLIAIFAMTVRATLDPDMWWHLRTGETIVQNGIPRQDVFSFTVPHHEWVTHEWLSQVVMWGVISLGGLSAQIPFFALINVIAFYLVYQRCGGKPYVAVFVLLIAGISSSIVWGARPQMFNILLTAFYIYIVDGVRQKGLDRKWLWALPIAMIFWANLHSGYLLGVVLLGTYTVGEGLQRYFGDNTTLDWMTIRQLALMTALSFLVAVLNPSGVELWIYPFLTLTSSAMQTYIQEWHSPDFHTPIFWAFGAMFFLGVISWVISPRKPTWTDLLLFLGTGAAGFQSARHIPLFALVASPIICRHLTLTLAETAWGNTLLSDDKQSQGLPMLNWALLGLTAFGALIWLGSAMIENEAKIAEVFPVAATDYIFENKLNEKNVYNSYNWGGYLIWRGIPVFVDGRADVYGDEFLFFYRETFDPQPTWRTPLDTHHVDYVLMETGDPLNTLLLASGEWQEVYRDDIAQIMVRGD
jgi:hypothetical protein